MNQQFRAFIALYLGFKGNDHAINESCYKGARLERNYRIMTIYGHYSIIPLWKLIVKLFWSHNFIVLYPNRITNQVHYKGTAL